MHLRLQARPLLPCSGRLRPFVGQVRGKCLVNDEPAPLLTFTLVFPSAASSPVLSSSVSSFCFPIISCSSCFSGSFVMLCSASTSSSALAQAKLADKRTGHVQAPRSTVGFHRCCSEVSLRVPSRAFWHLPLPPCCWWADLASTLHLLRKHIHFLFGLLLSRRRHSRGCSCVLQAIRLGGEFVRLLFWWQWRCT